MIGSNLVVWSTRPYDVRLTARDIVGIFETADPEVWSRFLSDLSMSLLHGTRPDELDWSEVCKMIGTDMNDEQKQSVKYMLEMLIAEL